MRLRRYAVMLLVPPVVAGAGTGRLNVATEDRAVNVARAISPINGILLHNP